MLETSSRDPIDICRADLLDNYFNRASLSTLSSTALRTRSVSMRDIFIRGALHLDISSSELSDLIVNGSGLQRTDVKDTLVLAELGRVVLLQNLLDDDIFFGEKLLRFAHEHCSGSSPSIKSRRVLIEHYIVSGRHQEAMELLAESPDIDKLAFGYLRAELMNPFVSHSGRFFHEWLEAFNRPFTHYGLAPIGISSRTDLQPFDRLISESDKCHLVECEGVPLVSVVLTVFEPDKDRMMTSVRSILNQTWKNFELIIVDDCSGPEFMPIFDLAKSLDQRVSVIHAEENRGTYIARNIGYAASNGDYITGQDDDDWSHPQRLESQVQYMEKNPAAIGCMIRAIRCDDNLTRTRLGHLPYGQNASSLFIRREGYDAIGGFLPARKGADTEYHYRLVKATGRPVATIREPLSIIRILPGSLSRGDFSSGWKHSARRSFRSAYEYWHACTETQNLRVVGEDVPNVEIPRRYRLEKNAEAAWQYDIVFVGDWENASSEHRRTLDEIKALLAANYRVGILHTESPLNMRDAIQKSLVNEIQELINTQVIDELFYDDVADVQLMIVSEPSVLQFLPAGRTNLNVESIVVVTSYPPTGIDGNDSCYRVQDCHTNAVNVFGSSPTWAPRTDKLRSFLEGYPTIDYTATYAIDLDKQWHPRLWYRSLLPVIGYMLDSASSIQNIEPPGHEVYSTDLLYDMRLRVADAQIDEKTLRRLSPSWIVYQGNELTEYDFFLSVDYLVYLDGSSVADEQVILEALAAGVIVITSPVHKPTFGEAAIYCDPQHVNGVIREFHSDFDKYRSQIKLAKRVLHDRFSGQSYRAVIQGFLSEQRA